MTNKGWVKLHREMMDNAVWTATTAEQKVIFLTLVLMVNHAANSWEWEGDKYHVEPGQTITSVKSICDLAGKGITPQKVKTALKKFEKYGILTNKSTKRGRLISLVNWAKYQRDDRLLTDKITIEQPTDNQQITTNNNDINDIMNECDGNQPTASVVNEQTQNNKTKQLITLYQELFMNMVGNRPNISQRDGKVLKNMAKERGHEETAKIIELYFEYPTENEKRKGYPITWLPGAVNRLLAGEINILPEHRKLGKQHSLTAGGERYDYKNYTNDPELKDITGY